MVYVVYMIKISYPDKCNFISISCLNYIYVTEVAPSLCTGSLFCLDWLASFSCLELPHSVPCLLSSMFVCVAFKQISCLHLYCVEEQSVTQMTAIKSRICGTKSTIAQNVFLSSCDTYRYIAQPYKQCNTFFKR